MSQSQFVALGNV